MTGAATAPMRKRLRARPAEVEETKHVRETTVLDDPVISSLYAKMLRESLALFARDVLHMEIAPHVLEWDDLVNTKKRLAINAARDHGKSAFFSYAYPIWRAVMEPGCEVYVFARTQEQAMEYIEIILFGRNNLRGMIDIPSLMDLVPDGAKGKRSKDKQERATRSDLRLKNGSRIRAVSFGKAIRGRHPKYVVCDDVLNDEDMWSETKRKKNIEYFKSAIVNMPPRDGQIIVVGTPYHALDLYGWLRENKKYVFKRYPGIVREKDGTERALFPWRWTLEELYSKREEIGSVAFAREILCEPVTDDISIFPSYLFPPLYDTTLTLQPKYSLIKARGWQTFMGVDLALSSSVGADYTVIFTVARDPKTGSHYLIDINRSKGLSFRKQLEAIERAGRKYRPNLIYIEANLFQRVFSDEMRRTTDLPVKPFITHATNKNPLDKGLPSLRILLENEKIVIPRGDEYSIEKTDIWQSECSQFGFVDGKLQGIGAHDDTVMAWWLAEEAVKSGGFSFSTGAEEEDEANDDEEDEKDTSWKREMGIEGTDEDDDDSLDEADTEDDEFDPFGT